MERILKVAAQDVFLQAANERAKKIWVGDKYLSISKVFFTGKARKYREEDAKKATHIKIVRDNGEEFLFTVKQQWKAKKTICIATEEKVNPHILL